MKLFKLHNGIGALMAAFIMTATPITTTAKEVRAYEGSVGSFANDALGDGHDRWQSAAYQRSFIFKSRDSGMFQEFEWRGRSQIVTPWASSKQPQDRPYSSVLGFGGFSRGEIVGLESHIGGEIIVQGDQTGLPDFQSAAHDFLGLDKSYDPSTASDMHVEDRVTFRGEFGLAKSFRPSRQILLRPYGSVAVGADQSATFGVDMIAGPLSEANSWTRDAVTGQLLTHQNDAKQGFSLVAGMDVSRITTSMHIPDESSVSPEETQTRTRLGAQFGIGAADVFFGQTWFSEGFVGQAETQRGGVLSVSLNF